MGNHTNMTEEEFLIKHGQDEVHFCSVDKYRVLYANDLFWVSGALEYRSFMVSIETVMNVFDLDHFQFGFK